MTTQTTLQTSRDLLQKAQTAYQNGDDTTCARFLGEAITTAFQELAAQMGHPHNNPAEIQHFTRTLDEKGDYDAIFGFGVTMLEHSQGADWTQDPEFAWQFDEFPLAISVTHDALKLIQSKMPDAQ